MDYINATIAQTYQGLQDMVKKTNDSERNVNQIVRAYGYPFEKHHYETKDGYINLVIRISGPKGTDVVKNSENGGPRKPVVILQHGLMDSCAGYVCNGTNSLGFILADNGYDVWINNSRGNRYSRSHVYLDADVDKSKFWDYSFEDMARYDQPALFDYVLSRTGVKSVTYIGHSQGTTQMFCALSENLDYFKDKLNLFIALAPVVRVDSCSSGIIKKLKDNETLEKMIIKFNTMELMPSQGKNNKAAAFFHKLMPELSNLGIKVLADDDPTEVNQNSLKAYVAHFPCGSSFKSVKHYKQLMQKKSFEYFDYGKDENLKKYGQESPPAIPLQNVVDFPIALMAGIEDKLAHINDVRWLKDVLSNQGSLHFYEEYKFGHLSFLIPNNLKHYQDILQLMKNYNPVYISSRGTEPQARTDEENAMIIDKWQGQE